jgi:DNA-binding SARP family transcriptional activator
VEFGLLGPLEVTDGGRPVTIPSAKQRILLACLLLRAGELVTVDELTGAIWGDDALPDDPRKVVQTYVTRLRKLLGGAELIYSRPGGYVIAVAPGDVDVGRFELLLGQAREAAGSGDRQAEAAALRPTCPRRRCASRRASGWPSSAWTPCTAASRPTLPSAGTPSWSPNCAP